MRILDTSKLTPDVLARMPDTEKLWVYNGLDCCLTHEIDRELDSVMDPIARATYNLSLALQAPVMEMNMRGVLVDLVARDAAVGSLREDVEKVDRNFDKLCHGVFGQFVNANSPKQVNALFYDWLALSEQRKRNSKGEWTRTSDRDSLEKLAGMYYPAKPFVSHILTSRDIHKQIATMSTQLSYDNRFKTSLSVAGTKTGRLASSMADFSEGSNLQNIDKRIRRMFIADPGYKLINVDLEQADARNIGAMVWNRFPELMVKNTGPNFLDACEGADLHTTVCQMVWPEFPWELDFSKPHAVKYNREIADQKFYREMTYRDTTKRLGHGSNFNGQPPQMAKQTNIEEPVVRDFQDLYFTAFPEVKKRIEWTNNQILEYGSLTTLYGRRRHFLKRRGDNKTLNEACAFEPQSMTAEEINYAMIKVFALRKKFPDLQLLLQVHDSLLIQVPEEQVDAAVAAIKNAFRTELTLRAGRQFYVPCEVQIGWNWDYYAVENIEKKIKANPNGLIKYRGPDDRRRV